MCNYAVCNSRLSRFVQLAFSTATMKSTAFLEILSCAVFVLFVATFTNQLVTATPLVGFHGENSGAQQQIEQVDENFNNLANIVDERAENDPQEDILTQSVYVDPVFSGAHIVGGQPVKPHSWPWQCRLLTDVGNGYFSLCGASVLSNNHLITAAHCVVRNGWLTKCSKLTVVCGDNSIQIAEKGEEYRSVARITVPWNYNVRINDPDIAVITLSKPLTFNKYVQPISLPIRDVSPGTQCVVTGWGRTASGGRISDTLQQVTLPVVSQSNCVKRWGHYITDNMLCAGYTEGGKSSCNGDSGGPLVCNEGGRWQLHGVVSWGHINCAAPNFPSVFARVTKLNAWIQKAIAA